MTVRTQVSEADVPKLKLGMEAWFTTLGQPDKKWHGKLRQILPTPEIVNNVVQGELYTAQKHGSSGLQEFSLDKLLDERPEHLMFNGSMNALTKTFDMQANVGETVRMFFGVGG